MDLVEKRREAEEKRREEKRTDLVEKRPRALALRGQ
jgi:hypothetical protein